MAMATDPQTITHESFPADKIIKIAKTKLFILFIDSNLIHWQFYAGFLFVFYIPGWWSLLEHFLFFHIGNVIIPTDFHIFRRGRSTTNQIQFQQPSSFLSTPVHAGAVELCGRPVTWPRDGPKQWEYPWISHKDTQLLRLLQS